MTSIAVPDSNSCHVKLLDLYLSHVPKEVIDRNERFYLHPSSKLKSGWYTTKPLGLGKVQTMVKRMFSEAKIEGNYTNHSLRTTGASQLFAAKVPEAIIQKRTGHRSLDSLRLYETRSTDFQQTQAVSAILSRATATFEPAIKQIDTSTDSGIGDNDEEFLEKYANQLDGYDNDDDEFLARYANELDA